MIDSTCFLGPRLKGRAFLRPEDFEPVLESGITKICIATTKVSYYDFSEGNREVMEAAAGADFLCPVVTFELGLGTVGRDREALEFDSRLYRLRLDAGMPARFADSTLQRFLEGIRKRGAGLIVHYDGISHGLVEQIAAGFPEIPLIVTGVGYAQFRSALSMFERFRQSLMDISFFSAFNGLEYLVEVLGADRLVFGTNGPVYPHLSNTVKLERADISDADRRLIAEQNLLNALGDLK